MKIKSVIDYCQSVKEDDILLKKKMFKIPIEDNSSPLITLTDLKPSFVFEPSFLEGFFN
jgi:hypothetical protein